MENPCLAPREKHKPGTVHSRTDVWKGFAGKGWDGAWAGGLAGGVGEVQKKAARGIVLSPLDLWEEPNSKNQIPRTKFQEAGNLVLGSWNLLWALRRLLFTQAGADAGLLRFLFLVDDDARRDHDEEAFRLSAVTDVLEQPVDVRNLAQNRWAELIA